jgi:tetratricopeptide (TPR) repeat protein
MFSEGNARDLIQQAVAATPDDAAAHYALALDLFEQRRNEQGFAALDQAVKLDSGYALEYFHLTERALELGQRDKAIDLLGKAVVAMPEADFLRLQLANHLIQAGRGSEAVPIVTELKGLKWSETIHPGVTSLLEEMQQVAKTNPLPRQPDTSTRQQESHPSHQDSRMPGFNHMMMGNPGR